MEINYVKSGDYYIPVLMFSVDESISIGKYGRMRRNYLKKHKPAVYSCLCLSGKLWQHIVDTDEQANRFIEDYIGELKIKSGITEKMKVYNPILWAGMMNNLKSQAEEIALNEFVFY